MSGELSARERNSLPRSRSSACTRSRSALSASTVDAMSLKERASRSSSVAPPVAARAARSPPANRSAAAATRRIGRRMVPRRYAANPRMSSTEPSAQASPIARARFAAASDCL